MKKIKQITATLLAIFATFTLALSPNLAYANNQNNLSGVRKGVEAARGSDMPTDLVGQNGILNKVTNTLLLLIGAVSVFMLILGGFRYVVSGGDSKKVTDAKNTILYAIIGLIIALFSSAIVTFVLNALKV